MVKPTRTTQPRAACSWTQTGPGHEVKCRLHGYSAPPARSSSGSGRQRVIRVHRRGERSGKSFATTTSYRTRESRRAYVFAQTLRGPRKSANHLPGVKEVLFKEDPGGIRSPPQAATLGVFRQVAGNLLVLAGFHSLTAGIPTVTGQMGRLWQRITASQEQSSIQALS